MEYTFIDMLCENLVVKRDYHHRACRQVVDSAGLRRPGSLRPVPA